MHFFSAGSLREFAGKCGKSGKPYKNISKHKDINTHTKNKVAQFGTKDYKKNHIKILDNHEAKIRDGFGGG